MATNYYEITLALAGVCQSAKLVEQFAQSGTANEEALKVSLHSLLQTAPQNTLEVYGGEEKNLSLGLGTLLNQLGGQAEDLTRYWLGLLALAGKLDKNPEAKSQLAQRLAYLPTQLAHYEIQSEQILSSLAAMYVEIISPLGTKIQVKGSPLYLQQLSMHNRIRACLLAGIRSAILWRQLGGSKWQLLFSRAKIAACAQQIYSSL
ncbi:high frequency lysogenization protein HflD [Mesocricetibacter intestinalis]|nr:high frequency lysogenization protein HflD [Mesocricetibacter intestinalis]